MDLVQDLEFFFHELGQMLLVKEEEVTLPLVAAEHTTGLGDPGVQPVVDLGQDGGPLRLGEVLHQVLIVVDEQHGGHGPGGPIDVPDLGQLGDVHPVGVGQEAAAPLAGADQVAVDPEAAACVLHLAGGGLLALAEPVGVEIGDHGGQLGVKHMLLLAGELEETVVGPDDLLTLRTEDHHGDGGIHHGILAGHVHIVCYAVQIFADLLPAAVGILAVIEDQGQHHHQLQPRQRRGIDGGEEGKQGQTDEIQLKAGMEELRDLS